MAKTESYYDEKYFAWQKSIGELGGKVETFKFSGFIKPGDTVLDFGCGGGYLLAGLQAGRKIGIEINDAARLQAAEKGIEVYKFSSDLADGICDVIVSNHALEHTLNPYEELKQLYLKLRQNGKIIFVVPNEKRAKWNPEDINKHLYTWAGLNIGNLFEAAGFHVLAVKEIYYRWPPRFMFFYRLLGHNLFQAISHLYGFLRQNSSQIQIVAEKQ